MEADEKVLRRIQKILALANNNPSKEEAEAAMLRAQEMMAKLGLSMSEVQGEGPSVKPRQVVVGDTGRVTSWWQIAIARVVAKNFRCRSYQLLSPGNGSKHCFLGFPHDSKMAAEIFRLAVGVARRDADKYVKREKAKSLVWSRSKSRGIRNDFLRGWREGLEKSFRSNAETKALVVVVPEEVNRSYERRGIERRSDSKPRASQGSSDAYKRGRLDGSRFNRTERIGPKGG